MKNYIKVLMQTGQDLREEFFKHETVAAFMVYENAVYIEGDEENYTQNHYKLFQHIYGKPSDYVVSHVKSIIHDCKITGYYQGNEIYVKTGKLNIKVISRQAE